MMMRRFLREEKGISPVMGVMLLMGAAIGVLGLIQAEAVPEWNKEIELEHADTMQSDFSELKKNIEYVAATDLSMTSAIQMGAIYPNRMILRNPGRGAWGTLKLAQDKWIHVKYIDSSGDHEENFPTSTITYMPNYQYTPSQVFVYEHGIIFRTYKNYPYAENREILTDGNYVYLLVVSCTEGSASTQEVLTFNVNPVSSPKGSVLAENLTIEIKTDFPDWWKGSLSGISGVHVDNGSDNISITFDNKVILKMGEVNVSLTQEEIERPPPKQLVKISGDEWEVPVRGSTQLVVEARDKYNNPVPQVVVNFSVSEALVDPENDTTGTDGRAATTLTTSKNVDVTAYTPDYPDIENVVFHIRTFRTLLSATMEVENRPLVTNIVVYMERPLGTVGGAAKVEADIDNATKYNIIADLVELIDDDTKHSESPTKIKYENGDVVAFQNVPGVVLRNVTAIWETTHQSFDGTDIAVVQVMAYNKGMQSVRFKAIEAQKTEVL